MRITLFTSTLAGGGAERAVVTLAEGFYRRGHDVAIVAMTNVEEDFYKVPEYIERIKVNLAPGDVSVRWYNLFGNIRRLMAIRQTINNTRPDITISFQDGNNELFILSSFGTSYLKILSSQNDIGEHRHFNARWSALRKRLYSWADQVVFLDKYQAELAQRQFAGWKCDGIANPVSQMDITQDTASKDVIDRLGKFPLRIAAMGRLAPQKGFDMLLEAYAGVLKVVPNVALVIFGEGRLRRELEEQCTRLGIQENVLMPGILSKPHSVIAQCDVFAFSSRYEGQGLALVEAMACGTPPVSFDCPSGPGLIIQHEVNGLLAPPEDIGALKDGLVTLLLDNEKRKAMAKEAQKASDKYNVDTICQQWEDLILTLQNK